LLFQLFVSPCICVSLPARLKGSTLVTNGVITAGSDEWAIYGGTGVFAMARGVIRRRYLADRAGGNTDELNMDVFCRPFGSQSELQDKVVHHTNNQRRPFCRLELNMFCWIYNILLYESLRI
jgi:hypothetical protein